MSVAHRDYFNALAPEWSKRMPDEPCFRDLLMDFGISPGDRVLDTGAGTGRMTKYLAELAGSKGCIVAQDFAYQMLIEGRSISSHIDVQWLCDDLCALGLKSDMFDKVLCFSVFPHLDDPLIALKEIFRVLRPGGSMLILHLMSSARLNDLHASLQGVVNQDCLIPAVQLAHLLESVGFTDVQYHETDEIYRVQGTK